MISHRKISSRAQILLYSLIVLLLSFVILPGLWFQWYALVFLPKSLSIVPLVKTWQTGPPPPTFSSVEFRTLRLSLPWTKLIRDDSKDNGIKLRFEQEKSANLSQLVSSKELQETFFGPESWQKYEQALGQPIFATEQSYTNYVLNLTPTSLFKTLNHNKAAAQLALLHVKPAFLLDKDQVYHFQSDGIQGFQFTKTDSQAAASHIQLFDSKNNSYLLVLSRAVTPQEQDFILSSLREINN